MSSVDFVFLDSGTGGIPYMLDLARKCPDARCMYIGDTAHFPYGEQTQNQIQHNAEILVQCAERHFHPKAVVIACNTMSVAALEFLRGRFPELPFVGTVPAIKLAASVTRNKKIGLLATNQSVNNPYTQKLIQNFASDCTVVRRGDPDLIAFVEKKLFTATEKERQLAVAPAAEFFREADVDTVILGCTHFTHIASDVQKAMGSAVKVIDSRDGVAKQALRIHRPSEKSDMNDNLSLFFTAAAPEQEKEYRTLADNLSIPYGGIISLFD
ncbi:MAG: glutamate racemase [Treponemataceae bacterium]|nr:glutamate racemase [Treponemataceae bacterium]